MIGEPLMDRFRADRHGSVLIIVDVQTKLAAVMPRRGEVIGNCVRLVEGVKTLGVPVLVTEQYPNGLGPTVDELKAVLPEERAFEKLTFSCGRDQAFLDALTASGRRKVILAGMEAHICILQTALDLMEEGYIVQVVKDATCSRTEANEKVAMDMLRDAGAVVTSTETVLYQMLREAGTVEFKALSTLLR